MPSSRKPSIHHFQLPEKVICCSVAGGGAVGFAYSLDFPSLPSTPLLCSVMASPVPSSKFCLPESNYLSSKS